MSAKAEADSTTQKSETVEPKKLSPYKLRRKEDRDLKFNRVYFDTSIIEDQDSTNTQVQHDEMSDKIACDKFVYTGDKNTLGTRWTTWNEIFDLYVTVNGLTDNGKIKASYLLLMGSEAYDIYKTKKKSDDTDTLTAHRSQDLHESTIRREKV